MGRCGPYVPGPRSTRCIVLALCELLTAELWLFFGDSLCMDQWPAAPRVEVGVWRWVGRRLCLLRRKSGVLSSISQSTLRIDGLGEERIKFILHNVPLNFTAQPKPNWFSLLDFLLCQNEFMGELCLIFLGHTAHAYWGCSSKGALIYSVLISHPLLFSTPYSTSADLLIVT